MSESLAMIDFSLTRTIAQADPVDALSLEGLRVAELTLTASDAAVREGLSVDTLRSRAERALSELGVRVTAGAANDGANPKVLPSSASLAIRVEVLHASTAASIAKIRLAADRLTSMRSVRPMRQMEAHESVITWQGLELGSNEGNTFASGAAAALAELLEEFGKDLHEANPRDTGTA